MQTQIFREKNEETVKRCGEILRLGGLLAIPTETVYGLGASMEHPEAVKRIFAVKGRPQDNPLILHVSGADQIEKCAVNVPETAFVLAEKFWPGPLTMILPKRENVPDAVTAGLDSVGVRCPDNEMTRRVINECGAPVAAPSANLSGKPSPTEPQHVVHDLFGKIEGILDGGSCYVGVESTIIDLTSTPPKLLRPGGITLAQLRDVIGEVDVDPAVVRALKDGEKPKAPGMKYRHYAPSAPLYILRGGLDGAVKAVSESREKNVAVLCFDEEKAAFSAGVGNVFTYGSADNPAELAKNLFSALRELDTLEPGVIFARCPEGEGVEMAVKNRLSKAAGYNFIDV